jgi:dihydrofolate synthase/folylpolyglutamate synthase
MESQSRYQDALDYIYSFVDYSLTHQQNLSTENFDLGRMVALVADLDDPQQSYPSIHVAGTKGKGSVSALCAAALQEQGYKVGLYTSPHLKDFEERIQINAVPISRSDLVDLVEEIKPTVATIPRLTTFEITTALAFLFFARQSVDIAVVEVGLGGRLDATNVITPIVSVITALYLEHTYILGDTLPKIAAEKAGIVKTGVPVVIAPQRKEARQVVERIASDRNAPLIRVGIDYGYALDAFTLDGQTFHIWSREQGGEKNKVQLNIQLLGAHQIDNAATAYVALQVARDAGFSIHEDSIAKGFSGAMWPARFEILQKAPPVVVDSAHTRDAALKLRLTLDEYFPNWPVILVFGVSEDKDALGIYSELIPRLQGVICTQSNHPRALDADVLLSKIQKFGPPTQAVSVPKDAFKMALQIAGKQALVLVTGSIFLAASARIAWFDQVRLEQIGR